MITSLGVTWCGSVRIGAAFGALMLASAMGSAAVAKECSATAVTAASEPSISRSVGAYPGSLFAWRKAAADRDGTGFNNWSNSEARKIECNQTTVVNGRKLWVCNRSARPCRGSGAEGAPSGGGLGGLGGILGGSKPSGNGSCSLTFPAGRKSVRPGDKGADVTKIQQALIAKGASFAKGADGNFGSGTERAVREFQRKQNISPADGFVGRNTCSQLGL
jgi:Putative peptidoglycan binding domain